MSLAELKRRLKVGVRVKIVERCGGQIANDLRTVAKVQTNAVAFSLPGGDGKKNLSWLWWHKGTKIIDEPNGFKVDLPGGNYLRFEWVDQAMPDRQPALPLRAEAV
jgi:hypothetical protein